MQAVLPGQMPAADADMDESARPGRFGLKLFLVSLTMVFGATLVGYLAVRGASGAWNPSGARLPAGLWVATAILVGCSVALHGAVRAARSDRQMRLRLLLVLATGLGAAFLAVQAANWLLLVRRGVTVRAGMYGFTLYLLTGLHAVHILGGLAPLAVVTARAFRGRYGRTNVGPVENCALYWHFLDAVWIVMFAVLLTGR